MKKIVSLIIAVLLFCISGISQEQNNNLTITECGQGTTEQEAINLSRKIAIAQVINVFASNSSDLMNNTNQLDKLISDETGIFIASEKVYANIFPRARFVVVMKYNISLDKLKSTLQNIGSNSAVNYNQFTIKIKKQLIEEQNEVRVIGDLIGYLHEPMQSSFNYEIISGSPKSSDPESKKWIIPLTAIAKTNENMDLCAEFFINTMKSICLSENEIKDYTTLNKTYYPLIIFHKEKEYNYYLRKDISCKALYEFQEKWEFYTRLFEVNSGIDVSYGNGNLWNYTKIYEDRYATDHPNGEELYKFNESRIWNNTFQYIRFNFMTKNQNAAIYKWEDEKNMSQIEKMSGYTIKPLGIISYYYIGGYVVVFDPKNGHGFVVAPFDIGAFNWEEANKACKDLLIGGVNGWELPSLKEIEAINLTQFRKGIIGDDRFFKCWTNQQTDGTYANSMQLGWGFIENNEKNSVLNVRPIRRF